MPNHWKLLALVYTSNLSLSTSEKHEFMLLFKLFLPGSWKFPWQYLFLSVSLFLTRTSIVTKIFCLQPACLATKQLGFSLSKGLVYRLMQGVILGLFLRSYCCIWDKKLWSQTKYSFLLKCLFLSWYIRPLYLLNTFNLKRSPIYLNIPFLGFNEFLPLLLVWSQDHNLQLWPKRQDYNLNTT